MRNFFNRFNLSMIVLTVAMMYPTVIVSDLEQTDESQITAQENLRKAIMSESPANDGKGGFMFGYANRNSNRNLNRTKTPGQGSTTTEKIKKAIADGASINFGDPVKEPLLYALLAEKNESAQALLDSGANPNIMYQGEKLVHYCLMSGKCDAELLIKNGADISGTMGAYKDVFDWALHNVNVAGEPFLRDLVKKGHDLKSYCENQDPSKNLFYQSLLNKIDGIKQDRIPTFDFFLGNGANINQIFTLPNGTTWTPLLKAIEGYSGEPKNKNIQTGTNGKPLYSSFVGELVRYGSADVNQKTKPIAYKDFHSPISFTLSTKTDPNLRGGLIAILLQASADFGEGIELFLRNGGNPNSFISAKGQFIRDNSLTLLAFAVDMQNMRAIKALVASSADVNLNSSSDGTGKFPQKPFTPLLLALRGPNHEIVEFLLSHDAHP